MSPYNFQEYRQVVSSCFSCLDIGRWLEVIFKNTFSEIDKPGEDGALPLHYAARFRSSATRQLANRPSSQVDTTDGEVSSVVAPLAQAISNNSLIAGQNGLQVWKKSAQTVQPFGYVKSGFFSMTDESLERRRSEMLAGCGTMLFQKILKSCSEMPFLVFWLDKFCPKCSLQKLNVIFVLVCMTLCANTWLYFIFLQFAFLKFSGYQSQLSILC